jgi:hypothetical protein
MRNFFGGGGRSAEGRDGGERRSRHSSGWKELLKHLQTNESLRVLDIGPTSSTNINFVTGLGHSIYMANLVEDASRSEWMSAPVPGEAPVFDVERFLATNLSFSGRTFDVVIFWDSLDYLPERLVAPLLGRLQASMRPGGLLLAFFHSKNTSASIPMDTAFYRYHLTGADMVDMRPAGDYPLRNIYNNRQIENLLQAFGSFRFFLAKDNLREVLAVR